MPAPSLLGWGALALATVLHASVAQAGSDAVALPPDRAVALALDGHPDLRLAETTLASARAARSASAVVLSNPQASAWTSVDGARVELDVSQPLSLTGEGWHVRRGARLATESAEAALARRRRTLAAAVRLAYVDAVVATGVVQVAREGSELAARLSYGVSRKHAEGEASTLDLRLARLAEVQATTRLLQARRVEVEALRRLTAQVRLPVAAEDLAVDPRLVAPTPPDDPSAERADVTAADAALQAARADLKRARAAVLPPVRVGLGVTQEDGSTFLGPSVGVTVPLFDRSQVRRAEAVGSVDIAEGRLATVRAVADSEQGTSAQRLAEAETAAAAVADADLAEARAALASIESGVLAGEIDLPTAVLLQSQVLQGEAAIVNLRGLVAGARIDRLLALDDDLLLGGVR